MNTGSIFHIPDDLLEEYAIGRLPDIDCAPVEEHLLICHTCQNNLTETDEYIRVMRAVLARLRPLAPKRFRLPSRASFLALTRSD